MGTYEIPAGMSIAATAQSANKDSRNHAECLLRQHACHGWEVEFFKTDETVEQPEVQGMSRGQSGKTGFSFL